MDLKSRFIALTILMLLMSACNSPVDTPAPTSSAGQLETMVAATLTAAAPPTSEDTVSPAPPSPTPPAETPAPSLIPTQALTPTPAGATVSGKVCYRTRETPAMTAYFQETEKKSVTDLPIAAGQITYTVSLAPGTYIAYAWLPDFSLGGLYSMAVSCGLKASCKDHSSQAFTVAAGDKLEGIDICDWYAFDVPLPPGQAGEKVNGAISGRVVFPGGSAPVLHVVAFSKTSGYWYYVLTLAGQSNFTIAGLPPGEYTLVAYTRDGQAGGYTGEDGALKIVTVKAGETTGGVILSDWTAPEGTFPQDPTKWQ